MHAYVRISEGGRSVHVCLFFFTLSFFLFLCTLYSVWTRYYQGFTRRTTKTLFLLKQWYFPHHFNDTIPVHRVLRYRASGHALYTLLAYLGVGDAGVGATQLPLTTALRVVGAWRRPPEGASTTASLFQGRTRERVWGQVWEWCKVSCHGLDRYIFFFLQKLLLLFDSVSWCMDRMSAYV